MTKPGGPRRLALVGCGFVGGIHSMVLWGLRRARLVDAVVTAACDADIERASMFALYHGADRVTDDPAEAMRSADAVWICTPTSTHRSLVELAGSYGLDVYCEKPLAPSLAEAEMLAATARASAVAMQVGLVLRYSAVLGAAHDAVSSGELGRLMAVTLRDDQYFPVQGQYASSWRADVSTAGGGALIEHSIHDLDVLTWLAGPVGSVSARTANYAGHRGIEDVAAVQIAHASGTTSSLVSVWHQVTSRPSTRRIEIFCERGMLWTEDEATGPLHLQTSAGVSDVPIDVPAREPGRRAAEAVAAVLELPAELAAPLSLYVRSDLAFLESLAAGTPPRPDAETALAAHLVADVAYRSAAKGGGPLDT